MKEYKKKNKISQNIIKKKSCNVYTLLLLSVCFVFYGSSFAADINQEIMAIIQDSQALEKEGSSDANAIIESSANVGDQYKHQVNKMIQVSKEAMKEHQCKVSSDVIPENNLKDRHTESVNGYYRYVFISTSLPKQALKEIFVSATKENALIVLRGFKNNSYLETQQHFSDLIRETQTGFVVDPELFETYKINVVPSFVVSREIECEGRKCSTPLHDKISGNISIDYAFDILSKEGDLEKKVVRIRKKAK